MNHTLFVLTMQIQFIRKDTKLDHLFVFFPVKDLYNQQDIHILEHRLLFFKELKDIFGGEIDMPKSRIYMNATALYEGINLEFTVDPKLTLDLIKTLEKIQTLPLPLLTKEEKNRIKKEMEERKDMNSFHKLAINFHKKIILENKKPIKIKPEDLWIKGIDFKNARTLLVGKSKGTINTIKWCTGRKQFKINIKPEKKYLNWYEPVNEYTYNTFFITKNSTENYIFSKITNQIFNDYFIEQYIKTGKAYRVDSEIYTEQNFIVIGIDIDTSDKTPIKINFPQSISKNYFLELKGRCIFQEQQDNDYMLYNDYVILGLEINDLYEKFNIITYKDFLYFYKDILAKIFIYWY